MVLLLGGTTKCPALSRMQPTVSIGVCGAALCGGRTPLSTLCYSFSTRVVPGQAYHDGVRVGLVEEVVHHLLAAQELFRRHRGDGLCALRSWLGPFQKLAAHDCQLVLLAFPRPRRSLAGLSFLQGLVRSGSHAPLTHRDACRSPLGACSGMAPYF